MPDKKTIDERQIVKIAKMKEQAIEILETGLKDNQNPILTISELVLYLPIVRKTFYVYKLNVDEDILDLLDANKVQKKAELRNNWGSYDSAPVLQIALYKLIGTKSEREILNNKPTDDHKQIIIQWGPPLTS